MEPNVTNFIAVCNNNFWCHIYYFNAAAKQVDYYMDSSPVLWENARWCLRIYPNGVSSATSRWIFIGLERQHAYNKHQIHKLRVIFRIMRYGGSILKEIRLFHVFHNQDRFCGGFLESIDRSSVEAEQRPPNSVVSFSCAMESFGGNYSAAGTTQSLEMRRTETILTVVSNNKFRWDIINFSELPKEVGYCIKSPTFLWGNATWCLRLHPNGEFTDGPRWVSLNLIRERSQHQGQINPVHVTFRIMTSSGSDLKKIRAFKVFKKNDNLCEGVMESVDRSSAETEQRLRDSVVSFSCTLEHFEMHDSAAGTSQSLEMKPTETILTVVSNNKFRWDILNFSTLPKELNHSMKSPNFNWENAVWCLRLYPNGVFSGRPRWMSLELVRVHQKHEYNFHDVQVIISIMTGSGSILKEISRRKVFDKRIRYCEVVLESIERSIVEAEQSPQNLVVSFHCVLEYFGQNDSEAITSQCHEGKAKSTISM